MFILLVKDFLFGTTLIHPGHFHPGTTIVGGIALSLANHVTELLLRSHFLWNVPAVLSPT
jgi:hypothetical protein